MESKNRYNTLLYGAYISLYANDMACNTIKGIAPYVKNKDKETRKIWGALNKRIKAYFEMVSSCVKDDGLNFLCFFNSVLDECCDEPMESMKDIVSEIIHNRGFDDDGLLLNTIIGHITVEMAVGTVGTLSGQIKKDTDNKQDLEVWVLTDLQRVMRNFYTWVMRKVDADTIHLIKIQTTPIMDKILSKMCNDDMFVKALQYADNINNN